MTLFCALPALYDLRFDFGLAEAVAAAAPALFADRFSLDEFTWLRSAFICCWLSAAGFGGIFDSGKATQAYSANQSAPLVGLKRIYFGNDIAVNAISDV